MIISFDVFLLVICITIYLSSVDYVFQFLVFFWFFFVVCVTIYLSTDDHVFLVFVFCWKKWATANPKVIDVLYALSTVFSTSLLLENR
jgi:hypothetical protein